MPSEFHTSMVIPHKQTKTPARAPWPASIFALSRVNGDALTGPGGCLLHFVIINIGRYARSREIARGVIALRVTNYF